CSTRSTRSRNPTPSSDTGEPSTTTSGPNSSATQPPTNGRQRKPRNGNCPARSVPANGGACSATKHGTRNPTTHPRHAQSTGRTTRAYSTSSRSASDPPSVTVGRQGNPGRQC